MSSVAASDISIKRTMERPTTESSSSEESLFPGYYINSLGEIVAEAPELENSPLKPQPAKVNSLPILPDKVGNYLRRNQFIRLKGPQ